MGSAPMVKKSFIFQIGRIGIPKQIRGEIFETLRARGVCSRIPHLRLSRRDSHGLFLAHVYARIIPYFISIPSGGRSVLPTFWNIWYNCLIKLNALLVRPREYLYIPKDNGLRAGCGNVFCRVPFVGCCQVVVDRVRTFCFRAPRLFLAASKRL